MTTEIDTGGKNMAEYLRGSIKKLLEGCTDIELLYLVQGLLK